MNVAGIIPVAGQKLDFNFPWDDCMMPIAKEYLAIERAVVECLHAGCQTIWIVCDLEQRMLIRYRLGDRVKDPVSFRSIKKYYTGDEREVPIYYVPILTRDYFLRKTTVWSIAHGAMTAKRIAQAISGLLTPDKYYVAFPYGVYHPKEVDDLKRYIKVSNRPRVVLMNKGKSAFEGEYLGFSFTPEDAQVISDFIRKEPFRIDDMYAAKHYRLEHVLPLMDVDEDTLYFEVEDYFRIDSWDNYQNYMKNSTILFRRPNSLLLQKEWNGIGVDDE